jgi:hypothetical protein
MPAADKTPLTAAQKKMVEDDQELLRILKNWILKRARLIFFKRPTIDPNNLEWINDWFVGQIMCSARNWRADGGAKWRTYATGSIRRHIPDLWITLTRKNKMQMRNEAQLMDNLDKINRKTVMCQTEIRSDARGDKPMKTSLRGRPSKACVHYDTPINDLKAPLERLTGLERSVVEDRYTGRLSAQEVGEKHGRDRAWCRRIETQALEKLGAIK